MILFRKPVIEPADDETLLFGTRFWHQAHLQVHPIGFLAFDGDDVHLLMEIQAMSLCDGDEIIGTCMGQHQGETSFGF